MSYGNDPSSEELRSVLLTWTAATILTTIIILFVL